MVTSPILDNEAIVLLGSAERAADLRTGRCRRIPVAGGAGGQITCPDGVLFYWRRDPARLPDFLKFADRATR